MQNPDVAKLKTKGVSAFWPTLFCFSLIIPLNLDVGSVRLSIYRIVLILLLFPAVIGWLIGKAGRHIAADYMIILFVIWSGLSMIVTMGFDAAFQPVGIWTIETMGAYFVARYFIRDEACFRKVVTYLFWIVMLLLPLAAAESLTNRAIALDFFGRLGKTFVITEMDQRLGLRRAQVVFEHPILFGVFASSVFALSFYVLGAGRVRLSTALRGFMTCVATFFSLSTGAFLSLVLQGILIGWDLTFRKAARKWTVLFVILVVMFLIVDAISTRTPFEVFITYLTFNTGNSYNRVLIWHYGTLQVLTTPLFGIGLSDNWARPDWMYASIDNFWLLIAVRHGIPAILFFLLAYGSVLRQLGKLKLVDEAALNARKGLLISIIGISISMCTVHLWNATYCLLIFLLGSGTWLLQHTAASEKASLDPGATGEGLGETAA